MTIALDRPQISVPADRAARPVRSLGTAAHPASGAALRPRPPFAAPGAPAPRARATEVTVTLTIALPAGTPDVEAARLADALRVQAQRLTAGRRAQATVDVASPHPFTATTPGAHRALPPAAAASAPASPVRDRRPGVVSPSSPARRDIENARRRALQATAVSPSPAQIATDTALVIDLYGRRVRLDGRDLELTYKEFELLAHLARHARRIVGRDELMSSVWADADAETGERTVDVHIRRVRTKLGRYRRLISTVRGAGYRLDPGSDVAILG
ncbi:winged helix-turn-helix domain-containing protein [Brachybacterium huguangmaarense]